MTIKGSPTAWIALTLLCSSVVIASGVVAQREPPAYEKPADRQADDGICYELMVKKLYQATDETNPNQEGYLRSAEAYKLLAQEHQRCQ